MKALGMFAQMHRHGPRPSSASDASCAWRWLRLTLQALVATTIATLSGLAGAEVSAQLSVASPRVEVGQPLRVQLDVSSDQGAVESPRLTLPAGFGLRGPSVSTRFSTSISGWSATTRRELGASWEVTAPRVGQFTIGPAQAYVEGKPVTSNAITIEVVPAGTLPSPPAAQRRRPRSLFDDDDFFQGFPGFGRPGRSLEDLFQEPMNRFPAAPPEYHQSEAKDPIAFLVATVDPPRAVVGQQVTLRIIAYGAAGRFREADSREPRRADFYSVPLWDNSQPQPVYNVHIGQADYLAVKIREYALFPLKSGKLEIGAMKMAFYGSSYVSRATGQPIERESQPLVVDVHEPPVEGRPLGYQVGDVGKFSLTANVSPRTLTVGDAFSVVAILDGEGRLPQSLQVPEQSGLEWLQPTLTEQQEVNARHRVSGKRTFTYIVKATREGQFDLGKLELPYYDPTRRKYAQATADLGTIVVGPATTAAPGATAPQSPAPDTSHQEVDLSELGRPRLQPRPFDNGPAWSSAAWVWPLVLGLPLGVLALQRTFEAVGALRRRRKERRTSLSGRALMELRGAEASRRSGAEDDAVASLERAVFLGIENATQVRARGVLRAELAGVLINAGLTRQCAEETVQLLQEIEGWRFSRAGNLDDLFQRATQLLSRLPSPARHKNKEVS